MYKRCYINKTTLPCLERPLVCVCVRVFGSCLLTPSRLTECIKGTESPHTEGLHSGSAKTTHAKTSVFGMYSPVTLHAFLSTVCVMTMVDTEQRGDAAVNPDS